MGKQLLLERLVQTAEAAPEPVLSEVLDFLNFLMQKQDTDTNETYLLSETGLRDWLRPEEDEAWQHLADITVRKS